MAKKLTRAQLQKYLNMTADELDTLTDKKTYQVIESLVVLMLDLQEQLNPLEETFEMLKETRLNHLFEEYHTNVIQIGNVLAAQIKQQRVNYSGTIETLLQMRQKLQKIGDSCKEENTKTITLMRKAVVSAKPSGFPKPTTHRVKVSGSSNYDLVTKEVLAAFDREASIADAFNKMWNKARSLVLSAWTAIKDRVVSMWKTRLTSTNNELRQFTLSLARGLRQGSPLREIMLPEREVVVPISLSSGLKLKMGGDSITKVVAHPSGHITVETTETIVKGRPEDILPKHLYRLFKPALLTAGVIPDNVKNIPVQNPVDNDDKDEALLYRERTKGFNPKVPEAIRLMYETKIDPSEDGDRFTGPDSDPGDQPHDLDDLEEVI